MLACRDNMFRVACICQHKMTYTDNYQDPFRTRGAQDFQDNSPAVDLIATPQQDAVGDALLSQNGLRLVPAT